MVAPTEETATGKYLASRQINGELPECVGHLPVGRGHEPAIVAVLTADDGEVAAVQLGHLTAFGAKSVDEPRRNLYAIDKVKAKGASFRVPAKPLPGNGTSIPDGAQQLIGIRIFCEGVEDALAVHRAIPYVEVCGVPGIGRLVHQTAKKGERVLVLADGDAVDSEAAKALTKGIDHLLLAGVVVTVARPPAGMDANALLCEGGPSAVLSVVLSATPAKLSPRGRITQLSRMSWVDFSLVVREAAKELKTNSDFLKGLWRAEHQDAAADRESGLVLPDDVPWPHPVTDIAAVCDEALTEVQRYVVADADDLAVQVIWSLGAHFVHHATITLTRYARLEIGGEDVEVGKTTLLNTVGAQVPRALPIGGSITAAAYYRLVDAHQAAVLLDEAHDLFRDKNGSQSHLLRILRSGHTRKFAYVLLTEPSPDGKHVLRRFSTWTAIAYTVIGRLPDAGTRSRSISIRLIRAMEGEVTADFDEGDSPVLDTIRQKFSRWAADQDALPPVSRPQGLYNRRWNNWAPLLRIAVLVGGVWPERIMRAAQRALVAPAPTNSDGAVALLTDIRIVLIQDRMESQQLCNALLALVEPSAEWTRIYRGREITPLYLRERLRGLVSPPGSQRWTTNTGRKVRGYLRTQFTDAFARYLPQPQDDAGDYISAPPPARPGPLGPPGPEANSDSHINDLPGTGSRTGSVAADPVRDPAQANPLNTQGEFSPGPGGPSGPGHAAPSAFMSDPDLRPPWEAPPEGEEVIAPPVHIDLADDDLAEDGSVEL
jgi:hypothetical protein